MATLRVDPLALDGYAGLLRRAADDARECQNHLSAHVPEIPSVTAGIINPLTYDHINVRRRLTAMLGHLVTLLDASQDEISKVSTAYRETDQQAAGQIDATYPPVARPSPRSD